MDIATTSTAPQRYYTPPAEDRTSPPRTAVSGAYAQPARQASYGRGQPPGLAAGIAIETVCHNIVVCSAASGGIGLSTFAAGVARRMAERDLSCALIDVDFAAGGLDVLLGVESEPGMRFNTIDAPLGRLDGEALNRELPVWDDVRVLPGNPWNGGMPDWWQTQAAVRALAEANRVVVVDAGRGELLDTMQDLGSAAHIVLVELSVLGLARAKRHIGDLERLSGVAARSSERVADGAFPLLLVGAEPRGTVRRIGIVSEDEASEYLSRPISGRIRAHPRLCADILSGLGIRTMTRANLRVIDDVCDWIDRRLDGTGAS
ncbi:cobyric acid synthase [Bifidobacterium aerophilum]|nr:cobyric acid synthase [Bifidobacterium aerophilum]